MLNKLEFEFNKDYQPTQKDLNAIAHLIGMTAPNTETPPPERYEITGDVFESEPTLDPNKQKKENDEDKETSNNEPTKH